MRLQRLRDLREDRDLTQTDVAQILHINQRTYSGYEIGIRNIPVQALIALAQYYNTSIDYLLYRTDETIPYPKKSIKKSSRILSIH